MNTLTTDLQKLEKLLKSATNARQRKMYQSLLDKALKDAKQQELDSVKKAEIDASKKVDSPVQQKQKKQLTEKVQEETKVVEVKTTKKTDSKKSSVGHEDVAIKQEKTQKANRKSPAKEKTIFQAVGLIKCTPQIKDDKLFITIDDQQYDLRRGKRGSQQSFEVVKLEIEQNGSKEMWLRVYPKIVHNLREQTICSWFTFVKAFSDISQTKYQSEDFVLRGIWQYVPYCDQPVITIYRNIEMLPYFKSKSSTAAKKAFARPQAFPVVWSAPIEPYKYNPQLGNDQQMPRYFVQVRAIFKNGQFEVSEIIEEPTVDIPKYIKPIRKKKKLI